MNRITRRRALQLAGLGAVGGIAGCLDSLGVGGQPGEDGAGIVESKVHPLGSTLSHPTGDASSDQRGGAILIDSADRLEAALTARQLEDRLDEIDIDEFDFDEAVLLYAWVSGPNTCYDELTVDGLSIDGGKLQATVESVGPEEKKVCGEAVTHGHVLIEVTVDGPLPAEAEVSLIDGWGEGYTVAADVDQQITPA